MIWHDSWGALRVGPQRLVAGERSGPLLSVAYLVDDSVDIAGQTSGGCAAPSAGPRRPASTSAAVVARLAAAGATCVGKTRIDQFGLHAGDPHSRRARILNPAAPDRVIGGASRGAAAAVAAGIAPVAIGGDAAGALSIAAASTGLISVHPTPGRVALSGMQPVAPSLDAIGWAARDITFAARTGAVLLRPQHDEPAAEFAPAASPAKIHRVLTIPADQLCDDPELAAFGDRRIARLAAAVRATVDTLPLSPSDVEQLSTPFLDIQASELRRLIGACGQQPPRALSIASRGALDRGATITATRHGEALDQLRSAAAAVQRQLARERAVLALPAAGTLPALLCDFDEAPADDPARPARVAEALGLAGITIPVGRLRGAPVSIALWGAPGTDEALWDLARAMTSAGLPPGSDA
jgi:amidase